MCHPHSSTWVVSTHKAACSPVLDPLDLHEFTCWLRCLVAMATSMTIPRVVCCAMPSCTPLVLVPMRSGVCSLEGSWCRRHQLDQARHMEPVLMLHAAQHSIVEPLNCGWSSSCPGCKITTQSLAVVAESRYDQAKASFACFVLYGCHDTMVLYVQQAQQQQQQQQQHLPQPRHSQLSATTYSFIHATASAHASHLYMPQIGIE